MANIGLGAQVLARRLKGRKLPTVDVPNVSEPELNRALEGIKEHLRMYEGDSGAPKERFVTIAELEDAGVITAQTKNKFAFIAEVQGVPVSQPSGSTDAAVINQTIIQGGGGGTDTLRELTDTNVASRFQNDFLQYQGGNWVNFDLFDSDSIITGTWTHTDDINMANCVGINWFNLSNTLFEFLKFCETPSTLPQPAWANVQFLATFNGTDGDTSYTTEDQNGYVLTFGGSGTFPELDNSQVKFGTTSGYNAGSCFICQFKANGDNGAIVDAMAVNDWCVEGWMRNETDPAVHSDGGHTLVSNWNAPSNQSFTIVVNTLGEIRLTYSTTGSDETNIDSSGANLDGVDQWNHIAVTYDNNAQILRMFSRGVMVYEDTWTDNVRAAGTASDTAVAFTNDFPGRRQHRGWVDDVRITVGEVVYTQSFTPPTEAHPIGTGGTPGSGGAAFYVGDPAYDTIIDGLTTNITSASVDIDGTLGIDGIATASAGLIGVGTTVRAGSGLKVQSVSHAGLYLQAAGIAADDGNWDVSALTSGLFRIATATDIDGSGNNAIAINRTGIVVDDITLGADTDITGALTATSYGGITEANLLDKTAAESLSGLWSFIQSDGGLKDMMRWRDSTDAEDLTLHYDGANFELRSENNGAGALYMQFTGGGSGAVAFGGAITATSYGGILQANLLDKTATETVSGTYTFTGPITGTAVASGLTNGLNLESLTPGIWFNETDAPANELGWKMYAATGAFNFYTTTDAGSSSDRIFHVDRTGVTVDQFVFDVPLLVSDVADFSSDVDINGGSSLFIKNGADSVEFAHDGTNLNIVGTNTTRLDFEGMSILDLQGPNMRIRSALESANYMTLDHDGTDFNMVGTGTTDWNITGLTGALLVSDIDTASGALTLGAANTVVAINGGDAFRVQNAAATDWAQFSHNGTDFTQGFTNTAWLRLTGLTNGVLLQDGAEIRIYHTDDISYLRLHTDNTTTASISLGTATELQLSANNGEVHVISGNEFRTSDTHFFDGGLKIGERAAAVADTTAYGQIWVKDTTPNELWFTDDAGTDFHLNTAQATAVNSQLKVLDTTTARTSTTTLADQTGLSGFEVLADTFYSFEGVLFFTSFTIPDFKFDFQHSNEPATFVYSYMYTDSTGDTTGHEYGNKAASETIIVDTDGGGVIVRFSGILKGHATLDSVMDFQWAQNTSSGSATAVYGGSWFRIERTV